MKVTIVAPYKKILFVFIFLTSILLLLVIYFSFTYAFISLEIEEEKFLHDFILKIGKDQEMRGEIIEVDLEKSDIFPSSGSKVISEIARGKVVIINNSPRDQTLVRTTRLLSPEGVLLRTAYKITIPRKGKTEVEVYADKPGKIDLPPTKFTIPGLRKELQALIYGQSFERIKGGERVVKVITQQDFIKAEEELKNKIKEGALEKLKEQLENYNKLALEIAKQLNKEVENLELLEETLCFEMVLKETKSGIGEEKDKFDFKLRLKALALAVNERNLENVIKRKLKEKMGEKEFLVEKQSYFLQDYNLKERKASLKINLEGKIKFDPRIFDKEKLVNKKEEEMREYFRNFKEIKNVEIKFSPFFIKRSPFFKERIIIKVL